MARVIVSGEAGESWTNDGTRALFQILVDWHHSCAVCIQYDHQVGSWWPIPYHRNCRCHQVPVYPGQTARPFVDYRAKILTVSRSQQAAIMGASNLALVESGAVKWDDVVTSGRIRSLREVAARRKLSVADMVKAGVRPSLAAEAHAAVHTGAHTAAEADRQRQVAALMAKGYTRRQVIDAAGRAVGSRLAIGAGPSGPSSATPAAPPTPRPRPSPAVAVAALPPAKSEGPPVRAAKGRLKLDAGGFRAMLAGFLAMLADRFGINPRRR